jgi:NifU-like protein involved in Fe-S cluster formation
MTATCREACCSVTPRLTVSELFDRGCRRNRAAALPIEGAQCSDADENCVRFSLEATAGKIISVRFRATTCATLIAYCEYIAEIVPGFSLEIAMGLTAAQLVASVPGVPAFKHERAVLAIAAFRAALAAAAVHHPSTEQVSNESRLYLRHATP